MQRTRPIKSLQPGDFKLSESELDEMKSSWKSLGVDLSEAEFAEVMKNLESGDFKLSESEIAELKDEIKNSLESTDFEVSDLDWIQWLRDHTGEPDQKLGRRMVEGRGTLRAVYSDLTVAEIQASELP